MLKELQKNILSDTDLNIVVGGMDPNQPKWRQDMERDKKEWEKSQKDKGETVITCSIL